jgi:hypothetical protein
LLRTQVLPHPCPRHLALPPAPSSRNLACTAASRSASAAPEGVSAPASPAPPPAPATLWWVHALPTLPTLTPLPSSLPALAGTRVAAGRGACWGVATTLPPALPLPPDAGAVTVKMVLTPPLWSAGASNPAPPPPPPPPPLPPTCTRMEPVRVMDTARGTVASAAPVWKPLCPYGAVSSTRGAAAGACVRRMVAALIVADAPLTGITGPVREATAPKPPPCRVAWPDQASCRRLTSLVVAPTLGAAVRARPL